MMSEPVKIIIISKGKEHECLVDAEDYELVSQYKWFIKNKQYAYGYKKGDYDNYIFMHRLLLNITDRKISVDHINHNGLDNRRCNIRRCTTRENMRNRTPYGKSRFLGVVILTGEYKGRGFKRIMARFKSKHLGTFDTEEEAAKVYDERAKLEYGEFANLNFK